VCVCVCVFCVRERECTCVREIDRVASALSATTLARP
jgi:hypothetical protein